MLVDKKMSEKEAARKARNAKLVEKISFLLKEDGLLVTRTRVREPLRLKESTDQVINRYLTRLDEHHENRVLIGNALVSYLHDMTADIKENRLNRDKTREVLLAASVTSKKSHHRLFLQECSERLLSADWTCQTREEIVNIIVEYFMIVDEERATYYEADTYPIFSFKKNGS